MKIFQKISNLAFLFAGGSAMLLAQSTGTITQTVNQRNTIGTLSATPNGTIIAGDPVTFTYILNTAGAPAPVSETVQFFDGANALGTPQAIGLAAASNLLPYSQVNTGQGWTPSGTAPTVAAQAVNGPDGSTNTATILTFANGTSTVLYAVPGTTSYASQQVTFSIWAQSATPTTLTLAVEDNPFVAANQSAPCAVTSTWQRCTLTYAFPANAGTGFSVSLASSSFGVPINVWGAQFEQAAQAGPYVSTIGTARPTGAQAGTVSFAWSQFQPGVHSITVQYAGDSNFIGSTSNAVALTAQQEIPKVVLTDSPAGTSVYGQAVTLTAQLSDQDNGDDWIPSGTVQFFDGATLIGTGTLNASGQASITLVGQTSLAAGSHSLTVQYSGDEDFSAVTSTPIIHVVTKASSASVVTTTVSSSLNPSVYGDAIVLSINVTSSVGVQPTGTVSVVDGGSSLGTLTLSSTGNASITIPVFTAGTHTIVVIYSGDSNYGN
jgi:hypothetical protein